MSRTLAGLIDSAESISSEVLFSVRCHEEAIGNMGAWFPHIWVRFFDCLQTALIHVRLLLADGTSVDPRSGMLIEDLADPSTVGECPNLPLSLSHTD